MKSRMGMHDKQSKNAQHRMDLSYTHQTKRQPQTSSTVSRERPNSAMEPLKNHADSTATTCNNASIPNSDDHQDLGPMSNDSPSTSENPAATGLASLESIQSASNPSPSSSLRKYPAPEQPPEQWHVVLKKKQITKPIETQKKPLGKLLGATRIKRQVFYMGGINTECSVEDIESFCQEHCRLLACRIIPSRRYGTQAARIVVDEHDGHVIESLPWPKHLYVRRWNFGPNGNAGTGQRSTSN